MANPDPLYLALLGSAESFRLSNPPNIRRCLQCLQGVISCKPPPQIAARTHLQIGSLLQNYSTSENLNSAHQHIEQAWNLSYHDPSLEDVKYESAYHMCEGCVKQGDVTSALSVLQRTLESPYSSHSHYWRSWLLFHQADLLISQNNYTSAYQSLELGRVFSSTVQSQHTELLFLLSKGLVSLLMKNSQETTSVMSMCGPMITSYQGSAEQREMLKAFFLVLQVTHYLTCGMSKSVKQLLRQLQESIQILTTQAESNLNFNPTSTSPLFEWMPKEHLCILVYLVTVFQALQGGYLERAQYFTDKALTQIHALKSLDDSPLLMSFQAMLIENIIMCHISTGNKYAALEQISELKHLCDQSPRVQSLHSSQLHTLLGLYAMSMNCMDQAILQLKTALQKCTDTHLWTFINLNLGIIYAWTGQESDFLSLLEHIHPHRVPQESFSLKASASYVNALQAYFQSQYQNAKLFLQETLKLADAEDLNKLTACGLVLLGQIFLRMGKTNEVLEMINPAMQLAQKIPDANIQLWGTSLLRDLYHSCGDYNAEVQQFQNYQSLSQSLLTDQQRCTNSPAFSIIQWLGELNHNGHTGHTGHSQSLQNETSSALPGPAQPGLAHLNGIVTSHNGHTLATSSQYSSLNML